MKRFTAKYRIGERVQVCAVEGDSKVCGWKNGDTLVIADIHTDLNGLTVYWGENGRNHDYCLSESELRPISEVTMKTAYHKENRWRYI